MSRVRNLRKRGRAAGPPVEKVDPEEMAEQRALRRADRILRAAQLSNDDAAVWSEFSSQVKPSRADASSPASTDRKRATSNHPQTSAHRYSSDARPQLARETLEILARTGVGAQVPTSVAAANPAPPDPFALPRQTSRKLGRGALSLDGRIDLHGLTRDAAYQALLGYLRRAQAQGARTVLVITGKGLDEVALRHRPFDADLDTAPRGVLKRAVPEWLASDAFASIVSGFGTAHVRHGGAGAIYVEIRRLK